MLNQAEHANHFKWHHNLSSRGFTLKQNRNISVYYTGRHRCDKGIGQPLRSVVAEAIEDAESILVTYQACVLWEDHALLKCRQQLDKSARTCLQQLPFHSRLWYAFYFIFLRMIFLLQARPSWFPLSRHRKWRSSFGKLWHVGSDWSSHVDQKAHPGLWWWPIQGNASFEEKRQSLTLQSVYVRYALIQVIRLMYLVSTWWQSACRINTWAFAFLVRKKTMVDYYNNNIADVGAFQNFVKQQVGIFEATMTVIEVFETTRAMLFLIVMICSGWRKVDSQHGHPQKFLKNLKSATALRSWM